MQVEIEDTGPSRKTLKVTVPPDRIRKHLEKLYQAAGQQVQMKGFRRGKIPRHLLKARFGDALLAEAKESIINETFREAMESNDMELVGQPKLDVGEEPLQEDGELRYSVEFELRPQVKVGNIKSIEVARQPTNPTRDEIDRALDDLAKAKRKLQPVEDELESHDFARVDMCYKLEGETLVQKTGLQINPSIPVRGCDADEFRGKLLGLKLGETVAIPIKYPDTFEREEARGKDGELEVKVQEILRFITPAIDDELAKGYEFDSLASLEEDLIDKIGREKRRAEQVRIEDDILDQLYAENPFDLPEFLVEDEVKHRQANLVEELQRQGHPKEEAEKRVIEARSEIEAAARHGIRNLFLIEGILKKEKLFVTETDVEAELKRIASANDTSLIEVRKHVEEKKLLPEIRLDIMNRKVREFLRNTAQISDSEGSEEP